MNTKRGSIGVVELGLKLSQIPCDRYGGKAATRLVQSGESESRSEMVRFQVDRI
jgi:hypothetical protein